MNLIQFTYCPHAFTAKEKVFFPDQVQSKVRIMFLGPPPISDSPSVCVFHSVNIFEEYRPVILQHGPRLGLSRVSRCLDAVYAFLVVCGLLGPP